MANKIVWHLDSLCSVEMYNEILLGSLRLWGMWNCSSQLVSRAESVDMAHADAQAWYEYRMSPWSVLNSTLLHVKEDHTNLLNRNERLPAMDYDLFVSWI